MASKIRSASSMFGARFDRKMYEKVRENAWGL